MTDNFAELHLFPRDEVVGVFRGFQQGGLEFHADLVLPYPESTEGGRRVSVLKRQEGAPVLLG